GRTASKKEPLKVFPESPVTGQVVQLLDGRYGPYLTDGVTNASLPKATTPEEIEFNDALNLLAARAAAGPPKKAPRKAAAKKATPKKTTKAAKKTPAKATKKKTTKGAKESS